VLWITPACVGRAAENSPLTAIGNPPRLMKFRDLRIIPAAVAEKTPASRPLFVYLVQSFGGSALRRVWQIFFGRKRRAESPRVSEIRRPVRNDFHTVVTKTGLSVTFKPTNSIYSFVTDNPDIARLGPVSFVGVQHARSNTEAYNSGEVEAAAHQVATEHASIHFCHFID
jgi:hypothetical protein